MRTDQAAQTRMGKMNFAVVGDQDRLHADIAVDQPCRRIGLQPVEPLAFVVG